MWKNENTDRVAAMCVANGISNVYVATIKNVCGWCAEIGMRCRTNEDLSVASAVKAVGLVRTRHQRHL